MKLVYGLPRNLSGQDQGRRLTERNASKQGCVNSGRVFLLALILNLQVWNRIKQGDHERSCPAEETLVTVVFWEVPGSIWRL